MQVLETAWLPSLIKGSNWKLIFEGLYCVPWVKLITTGKPEIVAWIQGFENNNHFFLFVSSIV